jgi:hypothetical protein
MAVKPQKYSLSRIAGGLNALPFSWVFAGIVVLLGGAFWYMSGGQPQAQTPIAYTADEIVHARPFRAVHEMGGSVPIPYLPTDQPQPKIVVPSIYFDFGVVGPRAIVEREFLVRNDGDAPLTISRAYTTCGCTVADFTARVVPPGKATLIKLIFDAGFHDVRGQVVKRGIIIENNDRKSSRAEIWVRAAVARS